MNRTYKRWTEEEKIIACQLLSQLTIKQVAKKMHRSEGSIRDIASNELKSSYCRSKKFREIEGLLQSQVARKLGVSRSHVNNWIKMNNLPSIKCGKKGFFVVNEKALYDWLRNGYVMLPMIMPTDKTMIDWVCYQRTQFLFNHISAQFFRKITHITRGALDNWIRNFQFPKPEKKIGKLGFFYNRKKVYDWAKKNPQLFPIRKITRISSYEDELEFFNERSLFSCEIRHSIDDDI